jgi:hypothetical protein
MKTDSQLQQDEMAELKQEPAVHAAQIGVEAENGGVTPAGKESSYTEKVNAERAAQRVNGVKALAAKMKASCRSSASVPTPTTPSRPRTHWAGRVPCRRTPSRCWSKAVR